MKESDKKLLVGLGVFCVCAGAWFGMSKANEYFNDIQVSTPNFIQNHIATSTVPEELFRLVSKGATKQPIEQVTINDIEKTLFPDRISQSDHEYQQMDMDMVLDVAVDEVDWDAEYQRLILESVTVSGTTGKGAFINGEFTSTGSSVLGLGRMTDPQTGQALVVSLSEVAESHIVLSLGETRIVVDIDQGRG